MSDVLVFPQLRSGAISSFPVEKDLRLRSVVNVLPGNEQIRYFDPGSQECEWLLSYDELEDDELSKIVLFFERCRGQLRSFTFCEPDANLLRWSERLTAPPWQAEPLLVVESGAEHTFRLRNTSQSWAGLLQEASVPVNYELSFALQARSISGCGFRIVVDSGEASTYEGVATAEWGEIWVSHTSAVETARCRLEIPAGAELHVRALRLCPQRFPGAYKKTFEHSGLTHTARFASDSLRIATYRAGAHKLVLRVAAKTNL